MPSLGVRSSCQNRLPFFQISISHQPSDIVSRRQRKMYDHQKLKENDFKFITTFDLSSFDNRCSDAHFVYFLFCHNCKRTALIYVCLLCGENVNLEKRMVKIVCLFQKYLP